MSVRIVWYSSALARGCKALRRAQFSSAIARVAISDFNLVKYGFIIEIKSQNKSLKGF
jgi:hypothetical protein